MAENPNTPVSLSVKLLEKLATDSYVCRGVTRNPNTPVSLSVKLLEKLATDEDKYEDKYVRRNVASNPNTPVILLEKLATDSAKVVRRSVAENPNTPVSLFVSIFNSLANATRPNLGRLAVFLSPHAEIAHLAKNFRSTNWLERYAIAQNPVTPDNTLKHLLDDGNKLVRDAAIANIKQRQEVK